MHRRADRRRIVVVGGGPRTVGTTFGGTCAEALLALRHEGYETVAVDASATSPMVDPSLSDRTYVEPLEPRTLAAILEKEAPSTVAATFGGPRALALVHALAVDGTLDRQGIDVLGVGRDLLRRFGASDLWVEPVARAGLRVAAADDARVRGWKAFEVHALHDGATTRTFGGVEGIDPAGVNAEDAVSVAPPMTLEGSVHELLERAAHAMVTSLGGYRGAFAVRFAIDPATAEVCVLEANLGLGALHALAATASGIFPVRAAIALALGRRLDELDLPAWPREDGDARARRIVVRRPRFSFDRFEGADDTLGPEKKSIGAAFGVGGTFDEALRKAERALEVEVGGRRVIEPEGLPLPEDALARPIAASSSGADAPKGASSRPRILVLGAGPASVGRDAPFDACVGHVTRALAESGFEAIVLDDDAELSAAASGAARLYVEPATVASISSICEAEEPEGILLSFGGRTTLATALAERGLPILGPPAEVLARLARRATLHALLDEHGIEHPRSVEVQGVDAALAAASALGFPVLVGGASSEPGSLVKIARSADELAAFVRIASGARLDALVVESFAEGAVEVDVDAVSDGTRVVLGGILEHLERAGVHPTDAAAILPPFTLSPMLVERIEHVVRRVALAGHLVGPVHVRLAVQDDRVLVLAVRAEAGRTVPFVSRATGVDLAGIAAKVLLGATLDALGAFERPVPRHVAARESVFPFKHLRTDTVLGPQAHATGEVLGVEATAARAYQKALRAIGAPLSRPSGGRPREVLLGVTARDERPSAEIARRLRALGFDVLAIGDVARTLAALRIPHRSLGIDEAARALAASTTAFAIVTAEGDAEIARTSVLRRTALARGVTCFTTLPLARLGCAALEEDPEERRVTSLQEWYASDA